jgi:glycosyltransferase involved in cell wall biosynthesis
VVSEFFSKKHNKTDLIITERKEITRTRFNEAEVILFERNKEEKKLFTPSEIINQFPDQERIILINHKVNKGVGAAIATGYKWCKDYCIDCSAVMAGDAQMDPSELILICQPVVEEGIDYVKGNRLIHGSAGVFIPKVRFIGNSILSILTKISSGYWRLSDTQTGYTAISHEVLKSIKIYDIYQSYGMPNDLLVKLNITYGTIREIPIKPVYRIGEKSKMKIFKVIPTVTLLLLKNFFKRIWIKYFIKDFHPLFILYHLSILLFLLCIPFGLNIINYLISDVTGDKPILNSLMFIFLFISAFQSLLFAMWMDIQDNERLYK